MNKMCGMFLPVNQFKSPIGSTSHTAYKTLHEAHENLEPTTAKLLPAVVTEALALPEPQDEPEKPATP